MAEPARTEPAAAPAPEHPLQRLARRAGFYGLFCAVLTLFYLGIELRGWGLSPAPYEQVPMSVRQSPGGYRSFHFWHRGIHGGK